MSEHATTVIIWLSIAWAGGAAFVCAFYGLFLMFKAELLSCGEVFARCCDGRLFRDALLWPFYVPWFWLPIMLLAAFVYAIRFTLNRSRAVRRRGYRTPYQAV